MHNKTNTHTPNTNNKYIRRVQIGTNSAKTTPHFSRYFSVQGLAQMKTCISSCKGTAELRPKGDIKAFLLLSAMNCIC